MPDPEKTGLMRSVNEGIALFAGGLESGDSGAGDRWSFVCECGSRDCVEWVELELPAYAQIRSCPDALVLAEGHSRVAVDGPGALRRDRVMTAMARKKLESRGRARSGA